MTRSLMIALAMLALTSGGPAFASGGGGGGGSLPSSSGPSYDPVEEYQNGVQSLRDSDFKKAEKAFKRVVRVARTDANSHYMLGLAHFGQDEFKSAAKAFAKSVRYDATNLDAHAMLGVAHVKSDRIGKADAVLATLGELKADCAEACSNAAAIDKAIADIEAAKNPSTEATETSSLIPAITQATFEHGDLLYSDAIRLINLERYDEAIVELKAAELILGPHPDVLTYLGFANRKKGQSETALTYYSAALEIAPDHLNANEYLGEYYVEQGNLVSAQVQLMKLEALCPFGCTQTEELRAWLTPDAA